MPQAIEAITAVRSGNSNSGMAKLLANRNFAKNVETVAAQT